MADEAYWTYKASSPTPSYEKAWMLGVKGTEQQWYSLSPGMRREIVRSIQRHPSQPLLPSQP